MAGSRISVYAHVYTSVGRIDGISLATRYNQNIRNLLPNIIKNWTCTRSAYELHRLNTYDSQSRVAEFHMLL